MKKIISILVVAVLCMLLGISVGWGRECDVSLNHYERLDV